MQSIELTATHSAAKDWEEKMKAEGVDISACYQCGKCTAGCPMAESMDYTTRQVVRLLQMGLVDEALRSNSIWFCLSCQTCSTRCPKDVDPAKMMEVLRWESQKQGVAAMPNVLIFHKAFLEAVKNNGRLYEMEMTMKNNLRSRDLFNNVSLGPKMMSKGKLAMLPPRIGDNGEVKKLFEKVRERRGG